MMDSCAQIPEEGDGGAHVAENGGKMSCCNYKYSKVVRCTTSSMDVVR